MAANKRRVRGENARLAARRDADFVHVRRESRRAKPRTGAGAMRCFTTWSPPTSAMRRSASTSAMDARASAPELHNSANFAGEVSPAIALQTQSRARAGHIACRWSFCDQGQSVLAIQADAPKTASQKWTATALIDPASLARRVRVQSRDARHRRVDGEGPEDRRGERDQCDRPKLASRRRAGDRRGL